MVKQLHLYMMCQEAKDEDFSGVLHKMNSYLMKQLLAKKKQSATLDFKYSRHFSFVECNDIANTSSRSFDKFIEN